MSTVTSDIEVTLTHGQADFRVDQPKTLEAGQRVQVWCSTCSKSFVWTSVDAGGVPPRFCGKGCRARNRKNWQRGEFYPCPTPSKRRFRSSEEAKNFLVKNQKEFGYDGQDVYACRCGVYHLGHGNWVLLKEEQ